MKQKKIFISYAITLIFLLGACADPVDENAAVYQTVRDINELQLATATISKTYTVRDPYYEDQESKSDKMDVIELFERSWHIIEHSVKIGERVGVYGIRSEYAAVIDLNDLAPDDIVITEKDGAKHIAVTLPPIEIERLGDQFETEVYHERTSGLRSAITEAERTAMRRRASTQLENDLKKGSDETLNGLKQQAHDKAIDFFSTFFINLGYSPTITFRQ